MKEVGSIYILIQFFTAMTFSIKFFPRKQGFLTAALFLTRYFPVYIYMYIANLAKNEMALNNTHKDSSNQILIPDGAFGY